MEERGYYESRLKSLSCCSSQSWEYGENLGFGYLRGFWGGFSSVHGSRVHRGVQVWDLFLGLEGRGVDCLFFFNSYGWQNIARHGNAG